MLSNDGIFVEQAMARTAVKGHRGVATWQRIEGRTDVAVNADQSREGWVRRVTRRTRRPERTATR